MVVLSACWNNSLDPLFVLVVCLGFPDEPALSSGQLPLSLWPIQESQRFTPSLVSLRSELSPSKYARPRKREAASIRLSSPAPFFLPAKQLESSLFGVVAHMMTVKVQPIPSTPCRSTAHHSLFLANAPSMSRGS